MVSATLSTDKLEGECIFNYGFLFPAVNELALWTLKREWEACRSPRGAGEQEFLQSPCWFLLARKNRISKVIDLGVETKEGSTAEESLHVERRVSTEPSLEHSIHISNHKGQQLRPVRGRHC